jgi:hypothetical protein
VDGGNGESNARKCLTTSSNSPLKTGKTPWESPPTLQVDLSIFRKKMSGWSGRFRRCSAHLLPPISSSRAAHRCQRHMEPSGDLASAALRPAR